VTAVNITDDNIIRRTRFACWVTKATDTHLEYIIVRASQNASVLHCNILAALYVVHTLLSK